MRLRRRALRGYSQSEVHEKFQSMQENHLLRMRGLQEELQALQVDNERLREQIRMLNEQLEATPDAVATEQLMADSLLLAHKEQSIQVRDIMERLNRLMEEQQMELENKRREQDGLLVLAEGRIRAALDELTGKGRGG